MKIPLIGTTLEMKKISKNAQAAKGTLKIDSFFIKQNKVTKDRLEKINICNKANLNRDRFTDTENCVVFVDETDDASIKKSEVSNYLTTAKTSASPIIRKRKASETISPPQKRTNVAIESRPLSPNVHPSTSEYNKGCITPTKGLTKPYISVVTPEKLLTPEALNNYNSPEGKLERFMEKICTPTSKKKLFDVTSENRLLTLNSNACLCPLVDTLPKVKKLGAKRTPKKSGVSKSLDVNASKDIESKTPSKLKGTPKKLFDQSPNNLNEFNVQIIDNFVTITPSKSNRLDPDIVFVSSSEKKQSSILKYISPTASAKSLEAKSRNECTPTRELCTISERSQTPKSKVKTKLDFSICAPSTKTSKEIIGEANLTMIKNIPDQKINKLEILPSTSTDQSVSSGKGQENDLNLSNIFSEDWDEQMIVLENTEAIYNLDLTQSQHCKIVGISPSATKSIVTLKSTNNGEKAICNLEGFWLNTTLTIGDTVYVSAKKINQEWIINNECGLLVYEPDLLISTTSVVNTLWCKRKSVLSDRFGGFDPTNQQMIVGILVHNLLQLVLKSKLKTEKEIEKAARELIGERSTILKIYECGVTSDAILKEILIFVPKIINFLNLYVRDGTRSNGKIKHNSDNWNGTIKDIDDIEDNIWCPELGVKGKVDITIKTDLNIMPLELKTGRATVSLEHRGQVMLYIMMMNKLGYNVPSGLLLYLREGVLREVPMNQREKRDIIVMRNELAYYLTRKARVEENVVTKDRKIFPPELPGPINHSSCAKCPYNVICTSYAKYNNEDISSKQVLKNIQDEVFFYIENSHLDYFMHWVGLISIESNSVKTRKNLKEIYTLPPKEREKNGRCLIDLKITNIADECNRVYAHTFEKVDTEASNNFISNGILENNYVVVSVDNRPAVASGFVTDITAKSITVTLDRNLNKKYANKTFFIDSYDSTSIASYNLASLTLLLQLTPRAEKLRNIVIDKTLPTFRTALPKVIGTKGKQILRRLNIVQQRAVLKAIAAKDYFLIKGLPGTGKTATIVALIQLLVELNKTVLVTSHTHSAVDNVCIRLVNYGVKLLRLGSESRINSSLQKYSEHNLTKNCTTPEQFEAVYNNAQVVAVTCLGSGHPILSKRTMDICIVDECTQVLQCSVIRPIYAAETFILIGDQDQLPPVVQNKEAINGYVRSLFERLYTREAAIALNLNYRMNSTITALANLLTYKGELLVGSEGIANATLNLPNKEVLHEAYKHSDWILKALDDSLENSVQFLDTGPVWNLQHNVPWLRHVKDHNTCINIYEASIVFHIAQALLKSGVNAADIGIVATYRAQVAQISALLQADSIDISTVDQFQGKDKNVMIYSATKSINVSVPKSVDKFELLEDKRRLTVAITRAKTKLIIIGDAESLKCYSTFQSIMHSIETNVIKLQDTPNFKWENVLEVYPSS